MSIQQKGTEIFDSPSTVSSKQRFGSWCAVNKCTSWPCLDSSRAASTTSLSAPPDSQTPCCLLLETTFCHLGLSVPPTFLLVHTLKRQQLRDENPRSCIFYVSHRSGLTNEEQKMDRSMEFLRREINASLLQKESCEQQQQQQQKHRKKLTYAEIRMTESDPQPLLSFFISRPSDCFRHLLHEHRKSKQESA